MFVPTPIQAFLDRHLDNHDDLKTLSDAEIQDKLNELVPKPKFHTDPFLHQKVCFYLGVKYPQFMMFADLGLGKTSLALNLIKHRRYLGEVRKALVLLPNVSIIRSWTEECKIHTPTLRTVELFGTKRERLKLLKQDGDVYLINYAGLQALLSSTTGKRKISAQDVDDFASQFEMMILDEVVAVKNPRSLTFKICDRLSTRIPYRYGLTGVPFGRHCEDLWAQFKVIDGGLTLSQNYFLFRSAFFTPKKTPWTVEWKLNPKLKDLLYQTIKHRSIRYRTDECLTLPPVFYSIRLVPLSEDAKLLYHNSENLLLNATSVDVKQNSFIQMREIATGFLNVKNAEGGTERIIFPNNPKLDLLESLVLEVPEDRKAIIFHEFTISGKLITDRLEKLKVPYRWIYGGVPDQKKLQYINEFQTDPKIRYLVANSRTGGVGLNLQCANYVFIYESTVSPRDRKQVEGRVIRPNQKNTIFITDIVTENTVELKILDFLKEGKSLLEALIETHDVKSLLDAR